MAMDPALKSVKGSRKSRSPDEATLETIKFEHQRWLTKLGILDRPWLILGSAPEPTLPSDILQNCARVDINNAGRTAEILSLGPADLTIRKRRKTWKEHPRLRTRGLLWFHTAPLFMMHLRLWMKPAVRVGSLKRATKDERDAIVRRIVGSIPEDIGRYGKATNGVASVCYALFLGVPTVVLSGISVVKMGHSYNEVGKLRKQIDEDRYVLQKLSSFPNVVTTEPELSRETGIRLVTSMSELR